jgi:nicotinamidase-related amidase
VTEHKGSQGAALLILDMLNDFAFEGAEALLPKARSAADTIAALRETARSAGVPVVYVNDNYGHWHSDKNWLIDRVTRRGSAGRDIVRRVLPGPDDYFVIKPQFSGFYSSNLPVLLPHLGVTRLILTGVATDICVLFTAADAHMRDYDLWVPSDAVAAEGDPHGAWALEIMRKSMNAEIGSVADLGLSSWLDADNDSPAKTT